MGTLDRWRNSEATLLAVYSLDCQFPSLLNLPGTISRSEIPVLGCPCDDEFWQSPFCVALEASSGTGFCPTGRLLCNCNRAFVVPPIDGHNTQNQHIDQDKPALVKLNSWSKYLVLLSIHVQIFDLSQEIIIVGNICGEGSYGDADIVEA
jgi:hypothetical protein